MMGELALICEDVEQTVNLLQQARTVANRQGALSLELRAAVSLARAWLQHGKSAEAMDLLSDIYGRFTEDFTTPDLREAKALLDELAYPLT